MKRLGLLTLFVVMVSLAGMFGVSRAADPAQQSILTQLQTIQGKLNDITTAIGELSAKVDQGTSPRMFYLTPAQEIGIASVNLIIVWIILVGGIGLILIFRKRFKD